MKISVVIPALGEADHIEAAIRGARGEARGAEPTGAAEGPSRDAAAGDGAPGRGGSRAHGSPNATGSAEAREEFRSDIDAGIEIVVVDGGSRDDTSRIAESAGVRVLRSAPGRARQLDAGVRATRGDVLLLLHADTRLSPGWARAIREALRDERVVGGGFRFRFDDRSGALRWIEWGALLRSVCFRWPYGDQALFVRRDVLDAIGGVPQVPLMEDLDLVHAMKRCGRLALLRLPAVTSARRYRSGGPLRTMLRSWLAAGAWTLGVDRARVAQWVRR